MSQSTDPIDTISGNLVDVCAGEIFPATVTVEDGRVAGISREPEASYDTYLMPGFVDGHLHVESSMLPPPEFARLAMAHGTVAAVSDPHEIGNVLGIEGVEYMIAAGDRSPMKFYFGAPSCVPATPFETAGAELDAASVDQLLADPRIHFLSEVMNWPGVLNRDPEVMAKIDAAKKRGKLVDGHAPGLRGEQARQYISAGISTDHETFTLDEALDKIGFGMRIGIREGSAAKNLGELMSLVSSHPDNCFFCTDDSHPDDLIHHHIDELVRRAVADGHACMDVLRVACVNAVVHYGLDVGLLRVGDSADFIEVDNLEDFNVLRTVIDGRVVAAGKKSLGGRVEVPIVNKFATSPKTAEVFAIAARGSDIRVIEAYEDQLVTGEKIVPARVVDGNTVSDVDRDVLKMAVVSRYDDSPPGLGFISNIGLKSGAIASSVAHDSHNIVAVGTSDETLCQVVNAVIAAKGGVAVVDGAGECDVLPLPIAGLMSDRDGYEVGRHYARLNEKARAQGCGLRAPLMTLSFMALLVIPELKLSDKGLFDAKYFQFVDLFAD